MNGWFRNSDAWIVALLALAVAGLTYGPELMQAAEQLARRRPPRIVDPVPVASLASPLDARPLTAGPQRVEPPLATHPLDLPAAPLASRAPVRPVPTQSAPIIVVRRRQAPPPLVPARHPAYRAEPPCRPAPTGCQSGGFWR